MSISLCKGNVVRFCHISLYGVPEGKICLGNKKIRDFITYSIFKYIFCVSRPLILLKWLCLSGSYVI